MYLYGASGHAKVIIEILELRREKVKALFDDNHLIKNLFKYPVTQYNAGINYENKCIVSIGDNKLRKKIVERLSIPFGLAIHPSANISKRAIVEEGTVVMAGVTINSETKIGKHCIINTNASIDHDCTIKDYVHISPNSTLCGEVKVGEGTHIGTGAIIIPGKKIGKWCVIGAGAVIINDIPDYSTVVGNPAKLIRSNPTIQ